MFIISLEYQVSIEKVDRFMVEHVEYLNEHYALGHFQLSGRKNPRTGGVIISTVNDRQTLDEILKKDPFYLKNVARYEVVEVIPTKAVKALEFLLQN